MVEEELPYWHHRGCKGERNKSSSPWWPCAWIAKTWSALSAPPAVRGVGGGGGGGGSADVLSTITMPRKVRVVVDPSSFSGMPNCSSIPYMAS